MAEITADMEAIIKQAILSFVATVNEDGTPSVSPKASLTVRDGALYFCTGPGEQKALNLQANDQCALTTGDNRWKAGLDVVVEGGAVRVTDDATLRVLAAIWETKYDGDWKYNVRDGAFSHEPGVAHVFEVRPRKVLAFAKGDFAQTRFRFDR